MARLGNAALQPTVMLGAELSETGGNEAVSGTSSSAGVTVSWEADVWGRVRAGSTWRKASFESGSIQ